MGRSFLLPPSPRMVNLWYFVRVLGFLEPSKRNNNSNDNKIVCELTISQLLHHKKVFYGSVKIR